MNKLLQPKTPITEIQIYLLGFGHGVMKYCKDQLSAEAEIFGL